MKEIFFAVPGDIKTQSGGYSYDRRLALELGLQGRSLTHLELGASYPNPTNAHASHAALALLALPADSIVIIDGLALGAMDAEVVAGLKAQLVALVHHPLALEGDLEPMTRRESLFDSERTNLRHAERVIVPSPHTAQLLMTDYSVPPDRITVARPGIDRPDGTASLMEPALDLVGWHPGATQRSRRAFESSSEHQAIALARNAIAGPALDADYASSLAGSWPKSLAWRAGSHSRVKSVMTRLSALYRSASLFALATRFEGYGMVFGEAMAHGLPIVSCAAGAVSETVPLAAARLVEPNDPSAFGAALAELLENHVLRAELASACLGGGSKSD